MMRVLTTPRHLPVLALCLTVLLVIPACAGRSTPTAAPSATPTPSPTPTLAPTPSPVGIWRMLPKSPLAYPPSVAVWTGTEFLAYSPGWAAQGEGLRHAGGAAYSPVSGQWRQIPVSPYLPANVEGGYSAVWTGVEMFVFGPMDAAFNPATRRWRKLSPGPAGPSATVWTGRYVLMWGGGCCGGNRNTGSRYDPVTDTWRPIPAAPLAGRHADGVWTGQELIVVGGAAEGTVFADAAAYNPATNSWRQLPRLPSPRENATLTWTGTEVLVVGGQSGWNRFYADALAYRPATNTWRRLAAMEVSRVGHVAVWTGNRLLVWGGHTLPFDPRTEAYSAPRRGLAYDPATDTWTALPQAPVRARTGAFAAWSGTEMLVWGGVGVAGPRQTLLDGGAYRP